MDIMNSTQLQSYNFSRGKAPSAKMQGGLCPLCPPGSYSPGMGLIFTPVLVRCLLGPLGLSGPMTSTSWAHRYSKQSHSKVQPASSCLYLPPPLTCLSLICAICDITVVVKKLFKIQVEISWLQCLKLVFLKMTIVLVFQNTLELGNIIW